MKKFLDTLPKDKAIAAIYYAIRILRHLKNIAPQTIESEKSIDEKEFGLKIINEITNREKKLLSELDKKTTEKYIIELSNYLENRNKKQIAFTIEKTVEFQKWRNESVHNYETRDYNLLLKPKVFISYVFDSKLNNEIRTLISELEIEIISMRDAFSLKPFIQSFIESVVLTDLAIFILNNNDSLFFNSNRLFELGYLLGKLGRENVLILLESKVQIPSDLQGLKFIYTQDNDWKLDLVKQIDFAGIKFDKRKLNL